MKQNFDQCLTWLLAHEGGYVNHPSDPGGETNLGVTKKVYADFCMKNDFRVKEMQDLQVEDVRPIYREEYWIAVQGDNLPGGLDWSVFDWAVNSGPGRSARTLQKIVGVKVDGDIGPNTLAAVRKFEAASLIDDMYYRRQAFYERLKTFETFGSGWTRRNSETREQAHQLELVS